LVSSTLEFILIDNKTTAVIAADKLFTEFNAPVEFFTDRGYQETLRRMYREQAGVLKEKLTRLFVRR